MVGKYSRNLIAEVFVSKLKRSKIFSSFFFIVRTDLSKHISPFGYLPTVSSLHDASCTNKYILNKNFISCKNAWRNGIHCMVQHAWIGKIFYHFEWRMWAENRKRWTNQIMENNTSILYIVPCLLSISGHFSKRWFPYSLWIFPITFINWNMGRGTCKIDFAKCFTNVANELNVFLRNVNK